MLEAYSTMEKERAKAGLPPLALTPQEVEEVCKGLESADKDAGARLRGLLENRVPPGVDPAAKVKAVLARGRGQGSGQVARGLAAGRRRASSGRCSAATTSGRSSRRSPTRRSPPRRPRR